MMWEVQVENEDPGQQSTWAPGQQAASSCNHMREAGSCSPADPSWHQKQQRSTLLSTTHIIQHWANTIAVLIHEVLWKVFQQQQVTDTVPLNFCITLCSNNHQRSIAMNMLITNTTPSIFSPERHHHWRLHLLWNKSRTQAIHIQCFRRAWVQQGHNAIGLGPRTKQVNVLKGSVRLHT